ncbi:hypothetical protein PFAG_01495 [Plasmodium falciparum Santa Lucia]|uniref:Uncharacterized protein n=3 Tax=Plasmodium falciparum TaxID=5833 RepID=A0A024XAU2_PLAFC|nr:hypothetical protein PFFVO_01524 [Plasmodium falciparum Vietnam Oak-Knoll (FVO)]ETW62599.1 hypothetical protein PFMC_01541 [Plasmodium falciparum CAMP/Malaysia]EUT89342.1 hypothetical protein PFAG_01495 [Plasmodium falciparum Santa Lucia]
MICLHQLICQLHMLVKINSLFDKREIIKNFRLYIKIYISNESNNFFPYINFLKFYIYDENLIIILINMTQFYFIDNIKT